MHQKCTRFKIVIKNLVGGRLTWALAHGAIEERMDLAREEIALVLDEWRVFFKACKSCMS